MNIKEYSHNLQNLYQEISTAFSNYQTSTGLNCMSSCGRCCTNPDVEATEYEMIPMALKIYQDGKCEEWIEKLEQSEGLACLVFQPENDKGNGKCGHYNERPTICRMFGVGGYYNKKHEVTLSICRFIKDAYNIKEVPIHLDSAQTPMMSDWAYKLTTFDPAILQNKRPINQALLRALHKISLYAQYQSSEAE